MGSIFDHPTIVFVGSFAIQCIAAVLGDSLRKRGRPVQRGERTDFSTILPAALTLLGLIIGFTFSMAVGRYDQRKNLEEEEANAIGTEYVRADLLPSEIGIHVRGLLVQYLDQRVLFYEVTDLDRLGQVDSATSTLQTQLWSGITPTITRDPTPVSALVASGMNDVLNSQGYTQAAWWNRIPTNAWILMELVAFSCNFLFGYSEHRVNRVPLFVFPLIVAISFFLIADIDSPRHGLIRVVPQNLIAVSQSLSPSGEKR